jgi:hypothetical protein
MANASAIQRRTAPQQNILASPLLQNPQSFQQNLGSTDNNTMPPQINQGGLTLQQVISLIDTRLVSLEKFMMETISSRQTMSTQSAGENSALQQPPLENVVTVDAMNSIIGEFNTHNETFAEEIANLKNIIINLQNYTMDVNKMLLEERIHILSDLGTNVAGISKAGIDASTDLQISNVDSEKPNEVVFEELTNAITTENTECG